MLFYASFSIFLVFFFKPNKWVRFTPFGTNKSVLSLSLSLSNQSDCCCRCPKPVNSSWPPKSNTGSSFLSLSLIFSHFLQQVFHDKKTVHNCANLLKVKIPCFREEKKICAFPSFFFLFRLCVCESLILLFSWAFYLSAPHYEIDLEIKVNFYALLTVIKVFVSPSYSKNERKTWNVYHRFVRWVFDVLALSDTFFYTFFLFFFALIGIETHYANCVYSFFPPIFYSFFCQMKCLK